MHSLRIELAKLILVGPPIRVFILVIGCWRCVRTWYDFITSVRWSVFIWYEILRVQDTWYRTRPTTHNPHIIPGVKIYTSKYDTIPWLRNVYQVFTVTGVVGRSARSFSFLSFLREAQKMVSRFWCSRRKTVQEIPVYGTQKNGYPHLHTYSPELSAGGRGQHRCTLGLRIGGLRSTTEKTVVLWTSWIMSIPDKHLRRWHVVVWVTPCMPTYQ